MKIGPRLLGNTLCLNYPDLNRIIHLQPTGKYGNNGEKEAWTEYKIGQISGVL